jgi:AraC-like DNA-binding protein
MRLSAEAKDGESGVREVRFYASYIPALDTTARKRVITGRGKPELVAAVTKPPYEYIWDLSNVPDQDNWRMTVYCDIVDRAGNLLEKAGNVHKWIVIDRNVDLSRKNFRSLFTKQKIKVDGKLDEWAAGDTLKFINDNNTITCFSQWDRNFLYFGALVLDERILTKVSGTENDSMPFWYYDVLTFFFDTKHDHSSFRLQDDLQFNIGPDNRTLGNRVEFKSSLREDWGREIVHAALPAGTPNDNNDRDTGYVIELGIPWTALGIQPGNGLALGFDIFNVDNDFGGTYRVSRGWSGTIRSNNNNPSEWGNLTLEGGTPKVQLFLLIAVIVLIAAGGVLLYFLRKKAKQDDTVTPTQSQMIMQKVDDFVNDNLADPNLTIERIGEAVGLSRDYVRKIIKSETGKTSPQYLNTRRISKARELLANTNMNVSEVAFAAGYDSLEYFVKIFKQDTGLKPSEYRLKHFKKA